VLEKGTQGHGGLDREKRKWKNKEERVEESIMENGRIEELGQRKAVPVAGREGPYGCETSTLPYFL
jgi:hypothetical protein